MADDIRLFKDSLTGTNPYEKYLIPRFDLGNSVTFSGNKSLPVYNWFHYKEGYSRDFVIETIDKLGLGEGTTVLDPFCGTGTTLLASNERGINSVGADIMALGVFVSRVKLRDYDFEIVAEASRNLLGKRFQKPKSRVPEIGFMDMKKAYNRYALEDLAYYREKILEYSDPIVRDFLLLALISVAIPASNIMKDGGVLKVRKKIHTPPVRHLLKNKLKRMAADTKKKAENKSRWEVSISDARSLSIKDEKIDAVITSPPYLNNVDYTKVYAIESSLLGESAKEMEKTRSKSMRSHIGARYGLDATEISDVLAYVTKKDDSAPVPPIVGGYLMDLYLSLKESYRALKTGGYAVYELSNSTLPDLTVDVDLMCAQLGEKAGYRVEEIWVAKTRWAGIGDVKKQRPVRESAVILKKD
jgi:hypothetical protein